VDSGYFAAREADSKWPSAQMDWAKHQTDFLLMGSWAPSEIGPSAVQGFRFRFVPLPGVSTAVPVSTIGFAIPAGAARTPLAERFITHFFKDGTLSKIATVAKNLTPNPELPAPDDLADVGRALETLPVSQPLDGILQIAAYVPEVFGPVNDELLKGRLDVPAFVADLVRRQAAYWLKN
jgi:raffinose/stachyose/melibiose transport system substrate-binding protein